MFVKNKTPPTTFYNLLSRIVIKYEVMDGDGCFIDSDNQLMLPLLEPDSSDQLL